MTPPRTHRPDYVLALILMVLLGLGLVMMYSISPILSHSLLGSTDRNYYFFNQLKFLLIGLVIWFGISSVYYRVWQRWSRVLLGLAGVSLLGLFIPHLSYSSNGATRWINLGLFSFQPAELLKLAFIIYLADWLDRRGEGIRSLTAGVLPFSILLAVLALLVTVFQRDLGTMLVVVAASVGMYWTAGLRPRHLGMLLLGLGAAGWLAILAFPHRLSRLATFLHPNQDIGGSGYHINQALIAIGSGGILGVGLGHSIQIYGYLPEAANDSIFAVIGEEFGLLGSVAVIALFGLLAYRGLAIARGAPDAFGRLLATGVSLWLLVQAAINIAAMLALTPLTGIPLPFISYGGSSLVISLWGAGILTNISKYTQREESDARHRQRGRDRGSYTPDSGRRRSLTTAR